MVYLYKRKIYFKIPGIRKENHSINYNSHISALLKKIRVDKLDRSGKLFELLKKQKFLVFNKEYQFDHIVSCQANQIDRLIQYTICYQEFYFDLSLLEFSDSENERLIEILKNLKKIYKHLEKLNKHPFWNSYCISSRMVNIGLFLSSYASQNKNDFVTDFCLEQLDRDYRILSSNLEKDCSGNHLLKNYTALIFFALLINDKQKINKWYIRFAKQISLQFMESGMHYENCIDYHFLMLFDIYIIELSLKNTEFYDFYLGTRKTRKKIQLFAEYVMINGEVPLFNDCFEVPYLKNIDILKNIGPLNQVKEHSAKEPFIIESNKNFTMAIDLSEISPANIPAHAHDAFLNFELWYKKIKIITDSGNGTYEPNELRRYFRSSIAHNVSIFEGSESYSNLYKSFRFGKRAKLKDYYFHKKNDEIIIGGKIQGYNGTKKMVLNREIHLAETCVIINDEIPGDKAETYIHFPKNVTITRQKNGCEWRLNISGEELLLKVITPFQNVTVIKTPFARSFYEFDTKTTLKINFIQNITYQIEIIK